VAGKWHAHSRQQMFNEISLRRVVVNDQEIAVLLAFGIQVIQAIGSRERVTSRLRCPLSYPIHLPPAAVIHVRPAPTVADRTSKKKRGGRVNGNLRSSGPGHPAA